MVDNACTKIRPDLELSQISPTQYEFFDSETNNTLHTNSIGYLLIGLLESADLTIEDIKTILYTSHSIRLDQSKIFEFLSILRKMGFLEDSKPEETNAKIEHNPGQDTFSPSDMTTLLKHSRSAWVGQFLKNTRLWRSLFGLFILFVLPWGSHVQGPVQVLPANKIWVRSPADGIITRMLKHESDPVALGEVVAEIDDQELQKHFQIQAPVGGVLFLLNTQDLVGKKVNKGDPLLPIIDSQKLEAEIRIDQKDINSLAIGKEFKFRIQADPRLTFESKIIRIAPLVDHETNPSLAANSNGYVRAYGEITSNYKLLKPGMTGEGLIPAKGIYGGSWDMLGLLWFAELIHYLRVNYVL